MQHFPNRNNRWQVYYFPVSKKFSHIFAQLNLTFVEMRLEIKSKRLWHKRMLSLLGYSLWCLRLTELVHVPGLEHLEQ